MDYFLILYFLGGIIQDFLFTLSLRLVNREMPWRAASVAFLDNFVSVGILYSILRKFDSERTLLAIVIYSFRNSLRSLFGHEIEISEKRLIPGVARLR